MLVIRNQQIQEFIARDETALVEVICRAVREANGERVSVYADTELAAMVRIGIERARSHGFSDAEAIAGFVAIMLEVAPRFDDQPDIRKVLENTDLPPETRLDQLFTCVPNDAWVEAGRLYEDSFWFPEDQQ